MDSDQAGNHDWVPVGEPEPGEPKFAVCWGCGGIGVHFHGTTATPLVPAGVGASDA